MRRSTLFLMGVLLGPVAAFAGGYQGAGVIEKAKGELLLASEAGGAPLALTLTTDAQRAAIKVGRRIWVSGQREGSAVKVSQHEVLPKGAAVASASCKALKVKLLKVYPWINAMPSIGAGGGATNSILVTVELRNTTAKPLTVTLGRAFLSFEARRWGAATPGISVRGRNGKPSGKREVTLARGETRKVELRGDQLYPRESANKTLHVGVVLVAGTDRLVLRGSGRVVMAR